MAHKIIPKNITLFLHTNILSHDCVIELPGISNYHELTSCVIKVMGIPESHNFSEGYVVELYDPLNATVPGKVLSDQNFPQLKDKSKIKVVEKMCRTDSGLPADFERPQEYIGIHLKHASLTQVGKLPNIYVSFSFKKKPIRNASSSIKMNNLLPVWNENFMLPLFLEHDSLVGERIQDNLIVKVVLTNEEKRDTDGLSHSGKIVKEKKEDDIKEIYLTKFDVQLSHLKKGEPMVFKIDFKTGFVIVDMLWFEDNRTIESQIVNHKTHGTQAITAGSTFFMPPPKDSYGVTPKRQELHWFCDLPNLNSVESLKKGDILLGKYYINNPILEMQEEFVASRGSKYSCHVAIVCNDGANCVAEASPLRKSVSVSPCFPEADFIVYRAVDQNYAKEAGDWAFDIATNYDVKYSIQKLSVAMSKEDSTKGLPSNKLKNEVLQRNLSNDMSPEQIWRKRAKKKLPNSMMSGQFVVAAYQCKPNSPYIKLNSMYITPMEFEDYLNQSPDLFYFVGKITQSAARKYNEEHNLKNIYEGNIFSPRTSELVQLYEKDKPMLS